jgi:ABC-type transport system substrate-binding protein
LQAHMTIEPLFRPQVLGGDAPWDIFVGSWGNSTLDPAGIFPPKFGSNAYGNYSGYASSELDRLMLEAQRTMDRAQRIDIYHRIQKIIFDEAPMIFGYAQDEYYGVAKRVKNFSPSATGMIDMHDVYVEDGD